MPFLGGCKKVPQQKEAIVALRPTFPIMTERLCLRAFNRGDVDAVFAYRGREDVARYLFDAPLSRDECALAIRQRTAQLALEAENDRIILAVELREGAQLVGEISLIYRSAEARQGEVGWIFHPDFQGRGFAREAAGRLLQLAFEEGEFHRIYARCDAGNEASWRLMERLGMRREAHFREHALFKGGWDEEYYYALLEGEWRQQHS